jgi:methionine-rich copper-binding protein CopC
MRAISFASAAVSFAGLWVLPCPGSAHAFLRHATPPVGSTVHTAPADVTITYTEGVEPRFSSIEVRNAQNQRVDRNDTHLTGDGDTHLSVQLAPIPPGTYTVDWHVTSVDTHKTEGHYSFTLAP